MVIGDGILRCPFAVRDCLVAGAPRNDKRGCISNPVNKENALTKRVQSLMLSMVLYLGKADTITYDIRGTIF